MMNDFILYAFIGMGFLIVLLEFVIVLKLEDLIQLTMKKEKLIDLLCEFFKKKEEDAEKKIRESTKAIR